MKTTDRLAELKNLEAKAVAIRKELGINSPGEVIYEADLDATSDDTVVVEADGFGGATTSVVAGHFPLDYTIKFHKFFPTEAEAESAAEDLACHRANPRQLLAAPA